MGVSLAMGQPLTVLDGADEVMPAAADASLEVILEAGGFAVVPGDVASARHLVGGRLATAPPARCSRRAWAAGGAAGSAGSAPRTGSSPPPAPTLAVGSRTGRATSTSRASGSRQQATPGAQVQAEISKDAFEGTAHALKSAARKKALGG